MKRLIAFCLAMLVTVAGALPAHQAAGSVLAAAPAKAHITAVGRIGGSSLAVAVQGPYAFVGQSAEFAVIDLHAPEQPRRVAYLPLAANDIALQDGYAYVTNAQGLAVIDVRQPAQPIQVAFQPAPQAFGSLVVAGHYVYAGAPGSGLFVYDIHAPAQPQPVASLGQVQVEGLAAHGDFLFLATGDGVQVVSIADPRRPVLAALLRTPSAVESVAVAGDTLFATDVLEGGLHVLNVRIPTQMGEMSAYWGPGMTQNVAAQEHYAYLASGTVGGITIVDFADPANPQGAGLHRLLERATFLQVNGDQLYAYGSGDTVQVLDIADRTHPVPRDVFRLGSGARTVCTRASVLCGRRQRAAARL